MGFTKTFVVSREDYDLDNPNDRAEVRRFEKELEPFHQRKVTVLGRELSGFNLFLHENQLFRYSKPYPLGAVVFQNISSYRDALAKYRALSKLRDRREYAGKQEEESANLLAQAVDLLGGKVVRNV